MIYHHVHDDLNAVLLRFRKELIKIRHCSEHRIYGIVIGDIIAVINHRGRIDGAQPDNICAELLYIIQL